VRARSRADAAISASRHWRPGHAAGLGPAQEHALISLLALNGLRVSEATGADIEGLGTERGHRTLNITRQGGKVVTIQLATLTARAIDLAIAERCEGENGRPVSKSWQRTTRSSTCPVAMVSASLRCSLREDRALHGEVCS
jgi:integrase